MKLRTAIRRLIAFVWVISYALCAGIGAAVVVFDLLPEGFPQALRRACSAFVRELSLCLLFFLLPPASRLQPPACWAASAPAETTDQLVCATVRVSIVGGAGGEIQDAGSGTVIDSQGEEALVATCAHTFRDLGGQGQVFVDVYGPKPGRYRGTVIACNLASDVALVSFRPGPGAPGLRAISLAAAEHQPTPGAAAIRVGCPRGGAPVATATQVISVNRYQHAPNVCATHLSEEGQSGGGLFVGGLLVGVLVGNDPPNASLYAEAAAVRAELDRVQLARVYQETSWRCRGQKFCPLPGPVQWQPPAGQMVPVAPRPQVTQPPVTRPLPPVATQTQPPATTTQPPPAVPGAGNTLQPLPPVTTQPPATPSPYPAQETRQDPRIGQLQDELDKVKGQACKCNPQQLVDIDARLTKIEASLNELAGALKPIYIPRTDAAGKPLDPIAVKLGDTWPATTAVWIGRDGKEFSPQPFYPGGKLRMPPLPVDIVAADGQTIVRHQKLPTDGNHHLKLYHGDKNFQPYFPKQPSAGRVSAVR